MILTCPECATRYFVEDQRLGAQGRTVRCASCGSAWRAHTEEPLELTLSAEEGAVAGEPLSFRPTEPKTPKTLAEVSAPELPKAIRAKAQQQRKIREAAASGIIWAGMTCAFALMLGGAYLFRIDVVKLYPKAAGAYAMAGVKVNPTGLDNENIKAAPAADGQAAVTITGVVRYEADHSASPPPLRDALLDKAGKRMATQIVRLPVNALAPGKAQAFSVSLPDPSNTANDVDVTFALELAKPPAKAAPKPQAARKTPQIAMAAPVPAPPAAKPLAPLPAANPNAPTAKASLRPVIGAADEARPLAAGDPYALDKGASRAVAAAPHG